MEEGTGGVGKLTVYQRMAAVLSELPAIGKEAYNQQQSFHYRSHDDVLNALNPLLAKWGLFILPQVLERTTSERKTRSGGTMYEVNLHVQYTFFGVDGDSVTASAWGEGTDSGDKSTNKAMTMAFKNVLAQAFAVSTADTIDSDGQTPEETEGRADARPASRVTGELEALIEEVKALDPDPAHGGGHYYQVAVNAAAKYHRKPLEDLAAGEMDDILRRFRGLRDEFLAKREGGEPGLPVEETVVKQGPAGVAVPTSWAELEAGVRAYGDETWSDFQEFMRQAKDHLFPGAERMSAQRKAALFQKASGVMIKLLETHDPTMFPPPARLEFQAHWAKALDGHVLPGPEWSMDASEASSGRPPRIAPGPPPVAPEGSGEEQAQQGAPAESAEEATSSVASPPETPPSLEQTVTDAPLTDKEQEALDDVNKEFDAPPEAEPGGG
jgi:hypothetical protein